MRVASESPLHRLSSSPGADLFERHVAAWLATHVDARSRVQLEDLWRRAVLDPGCGFLRRPGKRFRAQLVVASWSLAGGDPEALGAELPLCIEVLHAGSLIVDDVQDGSERRRGEPALHRVVGVPLAINTGNMFYCWALELLASLELPAVRELELHRSMVGAMLRAHQGQALDLSARICDTPQHLVPALVQSCTELKAGSLMELAATLGAVAAGAAAERVATLRAFGHALGCALQMLDDLSGLVNPLRVEKAHEDLRLARPTWAWAWLAQDLDAEAFELLQARARHVTAGADARALAVDIAALVESRGRARVHAHLDAALHGIRARLGPSAQLAMLQQEVARLEQSYG